MPATRGLIAMGNASADAAIDWEQVHPATTVHAIQ